MYEQQEHIRICSLISALVICYLEGMVVLLDFSLTVKAATLIFISGCGSAISSAKEGKSGLDDTLL